MKTKFFIVTMLSSILNLTSIYSFFSDGKDPKTWGKSEAATTTFAQQFAQQNGFEFIQTAACAMKYTSPQLTFALASERQITLEEAQKLLKTCVSSFLKAVVPNRDVQRFVRDYEFAREKKFKIQAIGVRISFWDEKVRRRMPPYIADMQFFEGAYHYYQSNEKQELVEIYSEPIEPLPFISSYEDMKYVPEGKTTR